LGALESGGIFLMKAKVQLLLKKMKNTPNISWNEKGELKYKKHESSTRFDWSRGPLEIHHSDQKNTEISQTTTESIPYYPPATGGQFHRLQHVSWEIVV
jgi:hypothetical protein